MDMFQSRLDGIVGNHFRKDDILLDYRHLTIREKFLTTNVEIWTDHGTKLCCYPGEPAVYQGQLDNLD